MIVKAPCLHGRYDTHLTFSPRLLSILCNGGTPIVIPDEIHTPRTNGAFLEDNLHMYADWFADRYADEPDNEPRDDLTSAAELTAALGPVARLILEQATGGQT